MNTAIQPLAGRRGLIVGVADEQSIAWHCARSASALGARLVLCCMDERSTSHAARLAAQLGAPLLHFRRERKGALQAMIETAALELGGFEFVVHATGTVSRTDLRGFATDSAAEGMLQAMRVTCNAFAELARLCSPHMTQGGALVTTSFQGSDAVLPQHELNWQVQASLESIVRYLALALEPWGLRVHAVAPGPAPVRKRPNALTFDSLARRAIEGTLARRVDDLRDIGNRVAFLVGPGATGSTGQTHYIDAGVHVLQ